MCGLLATLFFSFASARSVLTLDAFEVAAPPANANASADALHDVNLDASGTQRDAATRTLPSASPPPGAGAAAVSDDASGALFALKAPLVQKCCDDLDCSEGSPAWPGHCHLKYDCGSIFCPAEAVDETTGLPFAVVNEKPDCKSPAPPGMECVCGCRCVCLYPSGRVTWLDVPPPLKTPSPSPSPSLSPVEGAPGDAGTANPSGIL
jgi:hypothetical protein